MGKPKWVTEEVFDVGGNPNSYSYKEKYVPFVTKEEAKKALERVRRDLRKRIAALEQEKKTIIIGFNYRAEAVRYLWAQLKKAKKNAEARAKRAYDRGFKAGEHSYYFKHHKVCDG